MAGERNILLLLGCAAYVAGTLPPPTDIQISALGLGRVNVSWTYNPPKKDITYWVKVKTPDLEDTEEEESEYPSDTFVMFEWLAVPRGLSVEVAAIVMTSGDHGGYEVAQEIGEWASADLPPLPGDEGTAPTNLRCSLHFDEPGRCWLHCDWLPGEKAPLDTQYYLCFRHLYRTQNCLIYVTEPGGGRSIGCRTLFSDTRLDLFYFLVHINGSSQSRQIRATEHVLHILEAEVIPPVWNLSIQEHKGLSWTKPIGSMPDDCFNYQINIWSKGKNETIIVGKDQNFWNEDLKEPPNKVHVRVRAVGKLPCWRMEKYSSWTEVLHVEEKDEDMLWITLTVCLFVACLALFLLCLRLWRNIFPQIPKPKDDLKDAFRNTQHQALIRGNSWDVEEVISYIEVVGPPDKQCGTPLDYGQITD